MLSMTYVEGSIACWMRQPFLRWRVTVFTENVNNPAEREPVQADKREPAHV